MFFVFVIICFVYVFIVFLGYWFVYVYCVFICILEYDFSKVMFVKVVLIFNNGFIEFVVLYCNEGEDGFEVLFFEF